ncbi:MAG: hypothetical protein LBQ71_13305 [Hungatella sp.]|jgi:hypothetical protein|nr:hypothetical protein [Hungatella sp.]
MFIGQIGSNNYFNKMEQMHQKNNLTQIAQCMQTQAIQRKTDTVMIHSVFMPNKDESGFYKSNGNQMRVFDSIKYIQLAPDERLKAEILPASEQTSYTECDALLNQYLKQFHIDGHIEGDQFVRYSDEPVKLILADQVSDTDLENFRQQLNENGLGEDIDWCGVKEDLWNISVGFDNAERLEIKANYLASRYAVLKDLIQNQYISDKQTAEMDKLEHLYTEAKEEMANTYANSIGGFYEGLGQTDVASDMKASVLAMVDEKAAFYEKHLAQTGDYAKLSASENPWLKQDDAYLAARLRESVAVSLSGTETRTMDTLVKYNANDLTFAGVYAKSLSSKLERPDIVWDTTQDDSDLGEFLAKQNIAAQAGANNSGVNKEMVKLISNVFESFMNQFMDALDRTLDKNQEMVNKNPWMQGTVRTKYIDRNSVYLAFQNTLTNM